VPLRADNHLTLICQVDKQSRKKTVILTTVILELIKARIKDLESQHITQRKKVDNYFPSKLFLTLLFSGCG
jgi:hypothetical protein